MCGKYLCQCIHRRTRGANLRTGRREADEHWLEAESLFKVKEVTESDKRRDLRRVKDNSET